MKMAFSFYLVTELGKDYFACRLIENKKKYEMNKTIELEIVVEMLQSFITYK